MFNSGLPTFFTTLLYCEVLTSFQLAIVLICWIMDASVPNDMENESKATSWSCQLETTVPFVISSLTAFSLMVHPDQP